MNTMKSIRARLRKDETTKCLIWTGTICTRGYGQVSFQGRIRLIHRLLWEYRHGPIPKGFELDHRCRVNLCANLRHLEVVTHQVNVERGLRGNLCFFRDAPHLAMEKHREFLRKEGIER